MRAPAGRSDQVVQDSRHYGEVEAATEAVDGRVVEHRGSIDVGRNLLLGELDTALADVQPGKLADPGRPGDVGEHVPGPAPDVDQGGVRRDVLGDEGDG